MQSTKRIAIWSDDVVRALTTLWNTDAHTAAEISIALNRDFVANTTRNSVIGRAHKLGLKEKKGKRRTGPQQKTIRARESIKEAPKKIEPKTPMLTVSFMELDRKKHCGFLIDHTAGDFLSIRYCGETKPCAFHLKVMHEPKKNVTQVSHISLS